MGQKNASVGCLWAEQKGRKGKTSCGELVSKPINVQKDVHGFNNTLPLERGEAGEGGK